MREQSAVEKALDRWEHKGMLDAPTAAHLRAEVAEASERSGRRRSQIALSVAGGIVLVIAAGVLGRWLWPVLEETTRSLLLAVLGVAVHGVGRALHMRDRWLPASWALQTAGLLVLLGALLYSETGWVDASAGAVVIGLVGLGAAAVSLPQALGRDRVMPAVHLALAPAFLAVFLDRTLALAPDTIVWILDGVLALMALVLLRDLARSGEADLIDARLHGFVVALYAALALVLWTGLGPMDFGGDEVIWAVDVWWLGLLVTNLWALHRAPERLRRDWLEWHLAFGVLLAVPLVFWTCGEPLDLDTAASAVVLAGFSAAGIGYALRAASDIVLRVSALVLVFAAWIFGIEQAGAVGAAVALAFTAGVLLWLSVRVGIDDPREPVARR